MTDKRNNPYYQAQHILSRRDHSVFEVKTKLKRKRFSKEQIEQTISQLKKVNLLNDKSFAQMYVADTLRFKPVGPMWLQYKLKQKGIATSIIDQTISQAYQIGTEEELAKQAADSWRRSHSKHKSDKQRLIRFLQSRGFSYEAAINAVR